MRIKRTTQIGRIFVFTLLIAGCSDPGKSPKDTAHPDASVQPQLDDPEPVLQASGADPANVETEPDASEARSLIPTLPTRQTGLRSTFVGHNSEVWSLAISPDGNTVASGSHEGAIRLWDVASGKEKASLKIGQYWAESMAFSPDGGKLGLGCPDCIELWNFRTFKSTTLLDGQPPMGTQPIVVFSSDGKTMASGGRRIKEIRIWDVATGKNTATFPAFRGYGIVAMAFTPDNKTLISMGYSGGLKLWDVATGKDAVVASPHTAKLIAQLSAGDYRTRQQANEGLKKFGIRVLPALRQAATADHELEVKRRIQALASRIEDATLMAVHPAAAAFSPDGNTMATASWDDGEIKLWELDTGTELATLQGHKRGLWSLVFSSDGKMLASGGEGRTIKVWDVASRKELATLKGHTHEILCLAFSADSKMLVSGSKDKTIKLWDVAR